MKFNHENKWMYKYSDEDFSVSYSFTNDLDSGETLSSCTVTCTDSNGFSTTSDMISSSSVSSPNATFTISGGTAGKTYQIKIVGVTSGGADIVHYITLDVYGSTTLNAKLGDTSANSYVTLEEANEYIRDIRGHPNSWDTLSLEGRKRLLIEACKDISKFNFINDKYYDNQALPFPDSNHNTITGDVGTPITKNSFSHADFTSDTYGAEKSNSDYWKYGSVHVIVGTPLRETRMIETSNVTTDVVQMTASFSATLTTNCDFRAFEPLDKNIKRAQVLQALYILDNEGSDTLYSYKAAGVNVVKIGDVRVEFKEGASMTLAPISSEARKLLGRYIRKGVRVGRA